MQNKKHISCRDMLFLFSYAYFSVKLFSVYNIPLFFQFQFVVLSLLEKLPEQKNPHPLLKKQNTGCSAEIVGFI